jgi:hypothetical protein
MVQPRHLMAALLLLALTVAPSYTMPDGLRRAFAASNEHEHEHDRRDHGIYAMVQQ